MGVYRKSGDFMGEYDIPLKIDVLGGKLQQIFTPYSTDFGILDGLYSFSSGRKITDANAITIRLDTADKGFCVGYIDGESVLDEYAIDWSSGDSERTFGDILESKYFENIVAEARRDGSTLVVEPINDRYDWMVIHGLGSLLKHVCKTHVGNGIEYVDFSALDDGVFEQFISGGKFKTDDGREIELSGALRYEKSLNGKVVDVTDQSTPSPFIEGLALKIEEIEYDDEFRQSRSTVSSYSPVCNPCRAHPELVGHVRIHDCRKTHGGF